MTFIFRNLSRLRKLLSNPRNTARILHDLLRGCWYQLYYGVTSKNVVIRFPFFAGSGVRICGPGTVTIARNCSVFPNLLEGLTIVTTSKTSRVVIGENSCLGGTTIRCGEEVTIGAGAMTANSLIQDSWFCNSRTGDHEWTVQAIVRPNRIIIGQNVWLGGLSFVLAGSVIRDNGVLSAGALTYDCTVQEYSLATGNPVLRSVPIQRIVNLLRR